MKNTINQKNNYHKCSHKCSGIGFLGHIICSKCYQHVSPENMNEECPVIVVNNEDEIMTEGNPTINIKTIYVVICSDKNIYPELFLDRMNAIEYANEKNRCVTVFGSRTYCVIEREINE